MPRQHGLNFRNDGKCYGFRCARADVQSDGTVQTWLQGVGSGTDLTHQARPARRRTEQSDVADIGFRQRR